MIKSFLKLYLGYNKSEVVLSNSSKDTVYLEFY